MIDSDSLEVTLIKVKSQQNSYWTSISKDTFPEFSAKPYDSLEERFSPMRHLSERVKR